MPRFFTNQIEGDQVRITGADAVHIGRSLRMKPGEELTVSDYGGTDHRCTITRITPDGVELTILESMPNESEPTVKVTLYQALPKGDKLESILQKSVELGVSRIVPVLTSRCISRPDGKSMAKKLQRYEKIVLSAAKQCGRGILPQVSPLMSYDQAAQELARHETSIFCYEQGGDSLTSLVNPKTKDVGLLIGAEGGFDPAEAETLARLGVPRAGLGKRILRCETAPIAALAAIMLLTGNLE